ncbi:MAG: M14 family metallopeptidase [Butyricicoccus sp.]|nr:M14 family metallopeptidase [Butyricicoccus sp.]
MKVLRYGSRGPQVQLLQLALERAGYGPGGTDGIFGAKTQRAVLSFQSSHRLTADGVAGVRTHTALYPWYAGYAVHTLRRGDTLYKIAQAYGSSVRALEVANPGIDPLALRVGSSLVVPLGFPVVPTDIDYSSSLISFCCRGLAARYPFITLGEMGKSVMGRPLYTLTLGTGDNRVFYNASHHANEWITTPVLLHWCEELARAFAFGGEVYGTPADELLSLARLSIAPAVNPDGIDLVTGDLTSGGYYDRAAAIAADYPRIAFPSGWKANILGTDLNLQYPAGWSQAQEIKFAQGFVSPAPRDYVGASPLSAPESRAVYDYTLAFSPALTLSYHTQGNVIYWKYLDYEPPGSREIAALFGRSSGYAVEQTPYASGFAGYKDWFIQNYNRPGYTIEAGLGENPLPLSQFEQIYAANLGILTQGLAATAGGGEPANS